MNFAQISYLVVEDDGFQRWMLEQHLWHLKAAHVSSAPDGQLALEALRDGHFDVIISDLDMPGMDGMEFLRRLGELPAAPLVVLSTGQESSIISSVEDMAQAYGVRLLGSIEKPATRAKLAAILGNFPAANEASTQALANTTHGESLIEALRRGDIVAWFQPKVDVATGRIVGAEALARWIGVNGGALLPDRFLPEAERLGLMSKITRAIVAQSCEACVAWRAEGVRASVSFNMSPAELEGRDIADTLTATVQSYGLSPSEFVVEVTESAAARELGALLETLTRLRMRGFGLSIDDFGTGYASMQHLTRMPFTELKIDQAFVKGASTRRASRTVVESSVEIAAKLGLKTVAEGVETEAEWKLACEAGCDMAQGWLLGKAMPSHRLVEAIRRGESVVR